MADELEPPVHPGELLREEFLDPLGLDAAQLAEALGAEVGEVEAVLDERAPLGAELALRLARAFGQDDQYWLAVQMRYDLECVRRRPGVDEVVVLPQCRAVVERPEDADRSPSGTTSARR